jgi:hypothetical protein
LCNDEQQVVSRIDLHRNSGHRPGTRLYLRQNVTSVDLPMVAMDLGIASHVVRGWVKQGLQLGAVSQIVGQRNTKFLSSGSIRVFTNPFETNAVQ